MVRGALSCAFSLKRSSNAGISSVSRSESDNTKRCLSLRELKFSLIKCE